MQLSPAPRQQHETRAHGTDETEDHDAKRARLEAQKKQRIAKMMEFNESMIRTVKVGTDEFATLDDYENELGLDADTPEDDFCVRKINYVLTMYQTLCGPTLPLTNNHRLLRPGLMP